MRERNWKLHYGNELVTSGDNNRQAITFDKLIREEKMKLETDFYETTPTWRSLTRKQCLSSF